MARPMPQLMQGRAMPVDRLEIGLGPGDLNEIRTRCIEGLVSAQAQVDAAGTNERLDFCELSKIMRILKDNETTIWFGGALTATEQLEQTSEVPVVALARKVAGVVND